MALDQWSDFDHHAEDFSEASIWPTYQAMRECPVAHSQKHGGYWILTRYADVAAAARDHQSFSSAHGVRIPEVGPGRSIPLDFDPPVHTAYRALFAKAFTPDRVKELQPFVRRRIQELLTSFRSAGGGDVVAAIAEPLPLEILTEVVGFSPATVSRLRVLTRSSWQQVASLPLDVARTRIRELMLKEIAAHRASQPDDYLTWLLTAAVQDRPLTDDEIARTLISFAIAGHETTVNAIGNLIFVLVTEPGLQDQLHADTTVIPRFVEESLRLRTPAHMFGRWTTRPVRIGDAEIGAGEPVLLSFAAANRDEKQFPHAEEFDYVRGARGHLAFGAGIHLCVGAAFARLELRMLLHELRELPPLRLDGAVRFTKLEGGHHLGPRYLPVSFATERGRRQTP
jgi:cytochrome P450